MSAFVYAILLSSVLWKKPKYWFIKLGIFSFGITGYEHFGDPQLDIGYLLGSGILKFVLLVLVGAVIDQVIGNFNNSGKKDDLVLNWLDSISYIGIIRIGAIITIIFAGSSYLLGVGAVWGKYNIFGCDGKILTDWDIEFEVDNKAKKITLNGFQLKPVVFEDCNIKDKFVWVCTEPALVSFSNQPAGVLAEATLEMNKSSGAIQVRTYDLFVENSKNDKKCNFILERRGTW
jgi:hypothetical protein